MVFGEHDRDESRLISVSVGGFDVYEGEYVLMHEERGRVQLSLLFSDGLTSQLPLQVASG